MGCRIWSNRQKVFEKKWNGQVKTVQYLNSIRLKGLHDMLHKERI